VDGEDFEDLLTGSLSSSVRWQSAIPCPCTSARGGTDPNCAVCFGIGFVYGDFSIPFRCGLISQTAKVRAALAQMMGSANIGESVLVLPHSAPCYKEIRERDRIWDMRVQDRYRMVLRPGTKIALPFGYCKLQALVKSGSALVAAPTPLMDATRVLSVATTTTLSFYAPRGYEVIRELSHVRSFGEGLPRRLTLSLLDASMRSPRAAQTIER
jgi:hypothetical protein